MTTPINRAAIDRVIQRNMTALRKRGGTYRPGRSRVLPPFSPHPDAPASGCRCPASARSIRYESLEEALNPHFRFER